jgi:hypothetical protein
MLANLPGHTSNKTELLPLEPVSSQLTDVDQSVGSPDLRYEDRSKMSGLKGVDAMKHAMERKQ